MKTKILEAIQKIEKELAHEEGLELKLMGELGDLARIVLELKKRVEKLEAKNVA